MKRSRIAFYSMLAILLAATLAGGAGAETTPEPSADAPSVVVPESLRIDSQQLAAAMSRAFIDPRTGALRQPTRSELEGIAAAARRVTRSGPVGVRQAATFPLAGGGVGAEVPLDLMSFSTLRLEGDGERQLTCATGADDAVSVVAAPPAPQTVEER